ncbi:MAG: hypothetical protein E7177_01210 [Erysipelotrichaceae bacterium]|nr:hypothetical protein [Erysipelotrichaceae bacterium]
MKNKGISLFFKIWFHINLFTFTVSIAAIPLLKDYSNVINTALGIKTQIGSDSGENGSMYFDTKFSSMKEVREASLDIIEETVLEGAVLLKNDNKTLPLSKGDTVNLYGAASHYTVITGQGSSCNAKNVTGRTTLYQGLTNAGLSVNKMLDDWYKDNAGDSLGGSASKFIGNSTQESQYVVEDINWNDISSSAKTTKAKTGIMVIARNSGEACDQYADITMDDGTTRVVVSKNNNNNTSAGTGDALELTKNEKSVLENLKLLKDNGTLSKVIVLMNTASPLQCEFIDEDNYGIDACMWIGNIGFNGADAIGKLLVNDVNPSGKTTDTFFKNNKYNPVYYNFGSIQFQNHTELTKYFSTMGYVNNYYYVAYQEGIYNGYKYTETRYEDSVLGRENVGEYDYSKVVSYPFGYGLSYTDFKYSNMQVTKDAKEDIYHVSVDVENVGEYDGKETVQIYLQKPYTATDIANGVEKASVELVGFDKVFVKKGEKVTASIDVKGKYFAAYDADVEKTYVVGSKDSSDKYLLTAAKDSHDAINNILQFKNPYLDSKKIVSHDARDLGDKDLVWSEYIAYDNTKYSTNDFIESENENFEPEYEGQEANYGVSKITNQFEDCDFKKAGTFSSEEANQSYMSRNNWVGTYGKRITLTASSKLKEAQKNPTVSKDNIASPTYDKLSFYMDDAGTFDEIKLIYLRGKDYNDPTWDQLLDRISYEETCIILQTGLRSTNAINSIAAPSTSQQNGALAPIHERNYGELPDQSGFRGFAELLETDATTQAPPAFACNGLVAATYNVDLIERLGEQTGEEAAWAGYNGIYGLGVNIHRGSYCGRQFEYYSEDGFLTGVAAGYEAVGLHKMGVFVLAKHAVLNDQETHRAGLCVYANEQSIREVYSRALEVAIEIDREKTPNSVLGVMTGMNRIGAKWTGGQGFCNTVLKAEYGMRGFVVSDYNSSRPYMNPIQGVLYGNDLPDGNPAGARNGLDYDGNDIRFESYKDGYGELHWMMRNSVKNILYTIVNSNAMNGITSNSEFYIITPLWEKLLPVFDRVIKVSFIWSAVIYGGDLLIKFANKKLAKKIKES